MGYDTSLCADYCILLIEYRCRVCMNTHAKNQHLVQCGMMYHVYRLQVYHRVCTSISLEGEESPRALLLLLLGVLGVDEYNNTHTHKYEYEYCSVIVCVPYQDCPEYSCTSETAYSYLVYKYFEVGRFAHLRKIHRK